MAQKVLIVEDDSLLRDSVKQALLYHGFTVEEATNGAEGLDKVTREHYDLVLMDVNMPKMDGITALAEMKKQNPSLIVIIMTAYSNINDAVKAVKEGAYNYLEKPIASENLVSLIKRALKAKSLVETMAFSAPKISLGDSDEFVGESNEMQKVFRLIDKLAKVQTPVLIRGESGTGKELVAKAIHYNGPRKDEKFITINCGAIPDNLIESELFGHEKGAFTGAETRKIGKFQYANKGTLFLDEIGDISAQMQVKLLRVLQEKKFTPIGSNREISVDVRIIAASHKPFEEMIKEGTFREDLFYRLNVLPVYLPPLRERQDDVPHLIDYYVQYFNKIHGLTISGVDAAALKVLKTYSWPGNIRELRNVIEHAFIMESSDEVTLSSLPDSVLNSKSQETPEETKISKIDFEDLQHTALDDNGFEEEDDYTVSFALRDEKTSEIRLDFKNAKDIFEKEFIVQALKKNKGKINKTALNANIPKKTLLRKIEKYGINPKKYYDLD